MQNSFEEVRSDLYGMQDDSYEMQNNLEEVQRALYRIPYDFYST